MKVENKQAEKKIKATEENEKRRKGGREVESVCQTSENGISEWKEVIDKDKG